MAMNGVTCHIYVSFIQQNPFWRRLTEERDGLLADPTSSRATVASWSKAQAAGARRSSWWYGS